MNSITNEIVIASISDGVIQTYNSTGVCNFAPSIIEVVSNHSTGRINNAHNVALEILDIVVLHTIIDERVGTAAFVIQEIHVVGSPSLTNQKLVRTILPTQKFFR